MYIPGYIRLFICALLTTSWIFRESHGSTGDIKHRKENANLNSYATPDGIYSSGEVKQRLARFAKDPWRNCSTWAGWVNEHHPSPSQKDDREHISPQTIKEFCPRGNVTKFQCRDEKGEPIHQNVTASDGTFFISCFDLHVGVTCTVLDPTLKHCPDMSFRYFCSCPVIPTSLTGSPSRTRTRALVTKTPVNSVGTVSHAPARGTRAHLITFPSSARITRMTSLSNFVSTLATKRSNFLQRNATRIGNSPAETGSTVKTNDNKTTTGVTNSGCGIRLGQVNVACWIGVASIAGVLFIFSTILSVCLYKKAGNKLKNKRKTKVQPLPSVG